MASLAEEAKEREIPKLAARRKGEFFAANNEAAEYDYTDAKPEPNDDDRRNFTQGELGGDEGRTPDHDSKGCFQNSNKPTRSGYHGEGGRQRMCTSGPLFKGSLEFLLEVSLHLGPFRVDDAEVHRVPDAA